ncbi:MAG: TlpA disulfide reductase family protein [Solirubrobacteraceae bacterium]|nr:TlpA disulfide reductase family protein [Patulibacter sp.]
MLRALPMLRGRRRAVLAATVAMVGAAGLAGCGSGEQVPPALSKAEMQAALKTMLPDAPGPAGAVTGTKGYLAAGVMRLEQEAGTVLPGEPKQATAIYNSRLAALRGTPVVVNLWGDWCAPCQKEIPIFQRVALAERGRIAFLGVATFSTRAKTEAYLATKKWLPYPSVLDDDGQIVGTTHVSNVPQTIFYTATGKRFVHIGPYTSVAALETDIKRYGFS